MDRSLLSIRLDFTSKWKPGFHVVKGIVDYCDPVPVELRGIAN